MRALLDVNVLVALLDQSHLHHRTAVDWMRAHAALGWASCPLTQNGCVRVMSQPAYSNPRPTALVAERLSQAVAGPTHEFWSDSLSLLDPGRLDWSRVLSPRQITDIYLTALAAEHGGRFVTLDRGVSVTGVRGARSSHLLVIGAAS